jgi:flagellar biosynthesis/type III secretory pathway protein FliH
MRSTRLAPQRLIAAASVLFVGAALLLGATQVHAQWKWRDANGQVHASDLPPPREVPDKDVLQRPTAPARTVVMSQAAASAASAAAPVVVARPQVETELDKRRKAAEQEQQAKSKADEERLAAQRRENCARARGHASALESGQRIARTNEKGEREILDDKARADELRRTREIIASDCR